MDAIHLPLDVESDIPIKYKLELISHKGEVISRIYDTKEEGFHQMIRMRTFYNHAFVKYQLKPILIVNRQTNHTVKETLRNILYEIEKQEAESQQVPPPTLTDPSLIKAFHDINELRAAAPNATIDLSIKAPQAPVRATNQTQEAKSENKPIAQISKKPKIKFIPSSPGNPCKLTDGKYIPLVDLGNVFSKNIKKPESNVNEKHPKIATPTKCHS